MSEKTHPTDHEILSDLPPDTKDILIIPRYDDRITCPNCLVVDPYRDTEHGSTIMATVEHYLATENSTGFPGFPWTIVEVTEKPLVLKAAIEAALKYAEDNKVPVIFLNQGGYSTATEKLQTDTVVLDPTAVRKGLARTGAPKPT